MDQPISLTDEEYPVPGIVLSDPELETGALPPAVLGHRAEKYDYGLGDDSPGFENLYDRFSRGQEDQERRIQALNEDMNKQAARSKMIEEVILNRPDEVTDEEIQMVLNLPNIPPTNPSTVMEARYSEKVAQDSVINIDDEDVLADDGIHEPIDKFRDINMRKELAQKITEEVEAEADKQSWMAFGGNIGWSFLPGATWLTQMWAQEPGVSSSWVVGTTKAEQYAWLNMLPPEQFDTVVRRIVNDLKSVSLLEARTFMRELTHYSTSDKILDNIVQGADLAFGAAAVAKSALKGGAVAKVGNTLRSTAQALKGRITSVPQVLNAQGDLIKSAHARVIKNAQDRAKAGGDDLRDVMENTPSIYNPVSILDGAMSYLPANHVAQLQDLLVQNATKLVDGTLNAPLTVDRLTRDSAALKAALEEQEKLLRYTNKQADASIMDVKHVSAEDTYNMDTLRYEFGNAKVGEVKGKKTKKAKKETTMSFVVGQNGAELFDDIPEAIRYAKEDLGLTRFNVRTRGGKHYIEYFEKVREDLPSVRNALTHETKAQTPKSWRNLMFDWLRTPDEKMSADLVSEAKSIYGLSAIVGLQKEVAAPIAKLSKDSLKKFDEYTALQQLPNSDGTVGKYNRNMGGFAIEWEKEFGRLPTKDETAAYFTYVQMSDMNYAAYNIGLTAAKARRGFVNVALPSAQGSTPKLEATVEKAINWEHKGHNAGIVIWDKDPAVTAKSLKIIGANASQREIDNAIKENGYQVLQLTRFGEKALKESPEYKDVFKGPVNYVLVKDFKKEALSLKQVPYNAGPRIEYSTGWYMRQPHMATSSAHSTYYGDKNFHWFSNDAKGKLFVERFNKAREMLKPILEAEKDIAKMYKIQSPQAAQLELALKPQKDALKAYIANNLPGGYKKFKKQFDDGYADIDTPFFLTRSDTNVNKAFGLSTMTKADGTAKYPKFRDVAESPYNQYKDDIDLKFGMERDLPMDTIAIEGSAQKPVYAFKPASKLDARGVLDRSAAYLARSRYLNDLKVKYAEQFVEEFKDVLSPTIDELRADPIRYLFSEDVFKPGVSGPKFAAAKDFQRYAREFAHIKTDAERQNAFFRQSALNTIFKFNERAGEIAEPWLLHRIKEPHQYMRSAAFHLKMLSPHQLVTQAMSAVHMAALEGPVATAAASPLATLMAATRYTEAPEIISAMAKHAETFGMKADHFTEMVTGYRRSGAWRVDREAAEWGQYFDPTVLGDPRQAAKIGSNILELGRVFFKTGERTARNLAWTMSYKRWREANPTAAFNQAAMKDVRNRMDLYVGNMSSASQAQWQKGWLGVPTQFWSYQVRVAEQLWGKRLTPKERARMLTTYGMAYGMTGAVGVAAPVWPWHESMREYLLTSPAGEQVESNQILKLMNDGIISYALETGIGTQLNVQEQWGPGLSIAEDVWDGDTSFLEALGGVSGTTLYKAFEASQPLWASLVGVFVDDQRYPTAPEDWNEFFSSQAFYNNARKAVLALGYGVAETRKGEQIGGVAPVSGFFNILTGLQDQRISDFYTYSEFAKDLRLTQRDQRTEVIKNLEASIKADGFENQEKYRARAAMHFKAGMFRPDQWGSIISEVYRANKSLMDKQAEEYNKMDPAIRDQYFKRMNPQNASY